MASGARVVRDLTYAQNFVTSAVSAGTKTMLGQTTMKLIFIRFLHGARATGIRTLTGGQEVFGASAAVVAVEIPVSNARSNVIEIMTATATTATAWP